jgi:hypothetical protein
MSKTQKHTPTPLGWCNHPDRDGTRIVGARFLAREACDPHMLALPDEMKRRWEAHDDLVKALEPFATFCDGFDGMHRGLARDDDDDIYAFEGRDGLVRITLGDLRRARAALSKAGER